MNKSSDMYSTPKQLSFRTELKNCLNARNLLTAKSKFKVNKMLAESPPPEMNQPNSYRRQAIEEILLSEKSYMAHLELLIKYFITPIREKKLMDDSAQSAIFGQIELIHNLSKELLKELDTSLDMVAEAFLKLAPFFKLYSVYAFDYKNSLFLLQELYTKNKQFKIFIDNTECRPEVQMKLNALLITPIQRVPRYRLLLKQVLLYTSPSETDYKLLQESIRQIENTVSHIDSLIEDQESAQKIINLQNSLVNRMPNIVKPSRKILKEGELLKVASKGDKLKRHCVLMTDIFMYCKGLKERSDNTHVENSLACCCIFPLKKCKVIEFFPGNFKLICQGDGLIFCTDDITVGYAWVVAIREAIEAHIECRKTLRKESSKRKPIRKKELKKFESDLIQCKKVEYENVMRYENNSDSEGENMRIRSCFKISLPAKKLVSKTAISLAYNPFLRERNSQKQRRVQDDSIYGFTKPPEASYHKGSAIESNYQKDKTDTHDILFPLRSSLELKKCDKKGKRKNDENEIIDLSELNSTADNDGQTKRVKFNLDGNHSHDISDVYQFPKLESLAQSPHMSLRQKITNFFRNLF